jgi:hypothetical protein
VVRLAAAGRYRDVDGKVKQAAYLDQDYAIQSKLFWAAGADSTVFWPLLAPSEEP